MANIKSAIRRIGVAERNRVRRREVILKVRKAFKDAEKAIRAKANEAASLVKAASKLMDKAASNKVFHKNTAARHKSRLVKKLNQLHAATKA